MGQNLSFFIPVMFNLKIEIIIGKDIRNRPELPNIKSMLLMGEKLLPR